MLNFLKKDRQDKKLNRQVFEISDMDCSACAAHIDLDLEDLVGIVSSKTNYPKSQTTVEFDPIRVTADQIVKRIKESGYNATPIN